MKARTGFTLLELLVAVAVTLLLAGLLLTATTNLLQGWRNSQGSATIGIEAKLVLDQLERDFQSAIIRDDGKTWLDARIVPSSALSSHGWELAPSGVIKPESESVRLLPAAMNGASPNIADARFGRSGLWLRFVTSDYDATFGTLPAVVSYQVVRRRTATSLESPTRYALFRSKLTATQTFAAQEGSIFTDTSPAGLRSPSNADVIATNVIDFGLWLYSRDSNAQEALVFPASDTVISVSSNTKRPIIWIMARILTEEGAALIDAIENGRVIPPEDRSSETWWWEIAEAHSRVFVRRIEVKGSQL